MGAGSESAQVPSVTRIRTTKGRARGKRVRATATGSSRAPAIPPKAKAARAQPPHANAAAAPPRASSSANATPAGQPGANR